MTCTDPDSLQGLSWLVCYLTTAKHMSFYWSFGTVILTVLLVAPAALALGLLAALARRARMGPLRWIGTGYISMVRGIPDIIFFLFVPLAIDQAIEWTRHHILCPDVTEPIRRGNDFVVCSIAKFPLNSAPESIHDLYGLFLALIAFAIVFGAFAGNIIDGAMKAVPPGQLEAARALGLRPSQVLKLVHIPQMWRYALPGLSNLWQILIKATPILFVMGIEDAVYWARELGGSKTSAYTYPHPDWRLYYFTALLVFYLSFTYVSQGVFARLTARLSRGQTETSLT